MPEKITRMDVAEAAENYQKLFGANKNLYRVTPNLISGLKPGKTRAFYSMWVNDGRRTDGKNCKAYKVSTLATNAMAYHPHAENEDFFAYEGQDFAENAPCMVPIGSVGNLRGDRPAAGRYLSVKMSPYAIDCFFSEFDKSCVPMRYTFDEQHMEPEYLPAKYPHALVNPQFSGIGYTQASNIPSFNITELFEATIKLIKDKDAKIMLIPDIPTGCDIIDEGNFKEINKTGVSKLTMRASYDIDYQKNIIHFTSIPLQTNTDRIIKNIVSLRAKNKDLEESIIDIRDNTKKGVVDFSIYLTSNSNPDKILKYLFKKNTDLKKTFAVSITLIDDFKAYTLGVKDFLLEWIDYRRDAVRAMFNKSWQLAEEKKSNNTAIILMFEGKNAETTLNICRTSRSKKEIIERLMKQYSVTSMQAESIANMRMYNHSKEWIETFKSENIKLMEELDYIINMLEKDENLDKFIIDQLKDGIKKYGGPRKSKVVKETGKNEEELAPDTHHLIGITDSGIIKKISDKNSTIGVIGKGKDNMTVMDIGNRESLMIIDSTGMASKVAVSSIPNMEFSDTGIELGRFFKVNGKVVSMMKLPSVDILNDKNNNVSIILVTKNSVAKRVPLKEFKKLETSKPAITLSEGDELVAALFDYGNTTKDMVIYTNIGRGIRLSIEDLKLSSKTAKGTRQINLSKDEYVVGLSKIDPAKKRIFYITSSGKVKVTELKYFPTMQRKDEPLNLITLDEKETLVGIASVNKDDKVYAYRKVSEPVLIDVKDIEIGTRVSKGTKMIKTPKGDYVIGFKLFTKK